MPGSEKVMRLMLLSQVVLEFGTELAHNLRAKVTVDGQEEAAFPP